MLTLINNKPQLGSGIYTPPDIGLILQIPSHRIRWYIEEVWNNRFGKAFNERYSWGSHKNKAVNFLVLVEFKVVLELRGLGLSTRKIFIARNAIAKETNLAYPFASSRLLANSEKIWYQIENDIIDADGSRQMNFKACIDGYTQCIDFKDEIAERFFPDGRDSTIIVDPHHQFGQPTILGTNVTADTIYSMHQSGESVATLARLYDLTEKNISDVITFYHKRAA